MPIGHLYVSLKTVFQGLLPAFLICFLMLNCMSCLYILDINPLLVISFANIFCRSVSCLSLLSVFPFAVQKLIHLLRSHFFVFTFISFAWEGYIRWWWEWCLKEESYPKASTRPQIRGGSKVYTRDISACEAGSRQPKAGTACFNKPPKSVHETTYWIVNICPKPFSLPTFIWWERAETFTSQWRKGRTTR